MEEEEEYSEEEYSPPITNTDDEVKQRLGAHETDFAEYSRALEEILRKMGINATSASTTQSPQIEDPDATSASTTQSPPWDLNLFPPNVASTRILRQPSREERDLAVRQAQQERDLAVRQAQQAQQERDLAVRQAQQAQQERDLAVRQAQQAQQKRDLAVRQAQQAQQERDLAVRQAQQAQQDQVRVSEIVAEAELAVIASKKTGNILPGYFYDLAGVERPS